MSSSRTAVPFAQAAHSGLTVEPVGMPNTDAPPAFLACPSAMPRAETTGRRLTEAMATAALSITRLMIIAATSFWTATRSVATPAIFQANWSSRLSSARDGWTLTSCMIMARFLASLRKAVAAPRTAWKCCPAAARFTAPPAHV